MCVISVQESGVPSPGSQVVSVVVYAKYRPYPVKDDQILEVQVRKQYQGYGTNQISESACILKCIILNLVLSSLLFAVLTLNSDLSIGNCGEKNVEPKKISDLCLRTCLDG